MLALGCTQKINIFGEPSTPYHKLLKSMTRQTEFFHIDQVKYSTTVTYESQALRNAYVDEYAERYQLTADEKARLLENQTVEAEKFDVFFISHFASDKQVSRITQKAKTWKLSLNSPSSEANPQEPVTVTLLENDDPVLRYFHPYVTHWANTYRVKFNRGEPGQPLHLKMAGVVANLSFSWPSD